MEIKGSAVKSIKDFVEKKYPNDFNNWLNSLPDESRAILNSPIYATSWYPMEVAAVTPTRKLGEMFFKDVKKGAWETGRFSAEMALRGVYKIFVKATSPSYIIKRASKIFVTYYSPTELMVANSDSKSVVLHITKFPVPNKTIEYRIAGWMEKALELSGCKNIKIRITKSMTMGNDITEFSISWS
ncbi:MAG: hypothetical protein GXO79_08015 [Chlorobi bacterium]|nr:hypothetical protein [Chlorobiota bacterium]